jgi:ABC-type glycerol-3-phosphate transport system substrate-binding protein
MSTRYLLLKWLLATIAVVVFGMSCQSISNNDATEQVSVVTETATRVATQIPRTTPTLPSPTDTPESESLNLVFWTVEPISPLAEDDAGRYFVNTVRNFERANPDVDVTVLVKKSTGKGGVLDFLRTANDVAPTVLPDVVIMDATDIQPATAEQLIIPLDGKLDRSIVQDLLPAARRVGTVNETLMAVPLGIEMEHSVYNTTVFTATPILWTDVISRGRGYLFPAKGNNGLVNDVSLSHYFAAGGQLLDDENQPKLDEQPLREVLSFYQRLLEQEVIDSTLLEADSTADLWPSYLEGGQGLSQVGLREYLETRDQLVASEPSAPPLPNGDSPPVGIMHAWVLVLVSEDVVRQDAALKLIESFLDTNRNAAWNDINKSIPVRDSSYQLLAGEEDPYWQFLTMQLNTARPEPRFDGYDRVGRIFQQAIEQVIQGEATADEATSTALDALLTQ